MLKPAAVNDIPEAKIQVTIAAFPKGNRIISLRDKFATLYKETVSCYPTKAKELYEQALVIFEAIQSPNAQKVREELKKLYVS